MASLEAEEARRQAEAAAVGSLLRYLCAVRAKLQYQLFGSVHIMISPGMCSMASNAPPYMLRTVVPPSVPQIIHRVVPLLSLKHAFLTGHR